MTDQMQTVRDDIAYIRTLADEGRRGPPRGGAILLAAGLIWSATSLAAWIAYERRDVVPEGWQSGVWLVGMGVFLTTLALLIRSYRGKPGMSSVNNRVTRTAWSAAGWSIFVFVLAMVAACRRLNSNLPTVMIAPYVLSVYGVGWTVAASVSDQRWMTWTAVGSFAVAVIMGCLAASSAQYLAYAAALLLLMALPGWRLLRQEVAAVAG